MSSDQGPSGAGRGSAGRSSGGRGSSDESWFEVLNAPLPSEVNKEERPRPAARAPAPQEDRGAYLGARRVGVSRENQREPGPETAPVGRVRRPGTARRVRRTIKHIDPLSVLKISLITYAALLVGWLLFVAIFYNFLDGLGLFDTINSALKGFAYDEVDITLGVVEKWAFIAGIFVMIGGSILNVFLALIYNITSRMIGGIEVTFVERDS